MNCKSGDLATIVGNNDYSGRLVEVLYIAPTTGDYRLPDGYTHIKSPPECWIVKSFGSAFSAPLQQGGTRQTRFASIQDRLLRPLRGDAEQLDAREVIREEA